MFLFRNYHRLSSKELEGYPLFDNKTDDAIRQKAHRMGLKRSKKPEILDELISLKQQNAELGELLGQMRSAVDRVSLIETKVQDLGDLANDVHGVAGQINQLLVRVETLEGDTRVRQEVKALVDRFNQMERKMESFEKAISSSYI